MNLINLKIVLKLQTNAKELLLLFISRLEMGRSRNNKKRRQQSQQQQQQPQQTTTATNNSNNSKLNKKMIKSKLIFYISKNKVFLKKEDKRLSKFINQDLKVLK